MSTKADKLADSNAGAERLGRLMEAIEGPDWKPKGNGLMPTHYLDPSGGRDGEHRRTRCGAVVHFADITMNPTCQKCLSAKWKTSRKRGSPEARFLRFARIGGPGDCWEWLGAHDRRGYGYISTAPGKRMYAHRFSYQMFRGDMDDRYVCHSCDNPRCVNPDHLFLGSHLDNMRDAAEKGHFGRHKRVLTDEQLAEIRRIGRAMTRHQLAAMFGVSVGTISRVRNNQARRGEPNWKSNTKYPEMSL